MLSKGSTGVLQTGRHFIKGLCAHYPSLLKHSFSSLTINDLMRSELHIWHDTQAVVTYVRLWLDWLIRVKMTAKVIFLRFQPWPHKPGVECVPGPVHVNFMLTYSTSQSQQIQGGPTILLTHWGRATHICVSKHQSLIQIMVCRLGGAKPLSETMLGYC